LIRDSITAASKTSISRRLLHRLGTTPELRLFRHARVGIPEQPRNHRALHLLRLISGKEAESGKDKASRSKPFLAGPVVKAALKY
jgi:hypothetical protein